MVAEKSIFSIKNGRDAQFGRLQNVAIDFLTITKFKIVNLIFLK